MSLPFNRSPLFQPQVSRGQLDLQAPDILKPPQDLRRGVLGPGRASENGLLVGRNEAVEGLNDGSEESEEEGVAAVVVGIGSGDNPVNPEKQRIHLRDEGVEPPGNRPAPNEGFDVGDFAEDVENNRVRYAVKPIIELKPISRMLHSNLHVGRTRIS